MGIIRLVPLEFRDQKLFSHLQSELNRYLGIKVIVDSISMSIDFAFDARRTQFYSTQIIEKLQRRYPVSSDKVIAIVDEDIFIPILTFVFGEAQLNGTYGIVSCTRLRNEYYGRPQNRKLFMGRTLKEIVHELGHTFGLKHCPMASCVMFSSHNMEDTDHKSYRFCSSCLDKFLIQRQSFLNP